MTRQDTPTSHDDTHQLQQALGVLWPWLNAAENHIVSLRMELIEAKALLLDMRQHQGRIQPFIARMDAILAKRAEHEPWRPSAVKAEE